MEDNKMAMPNDLIDLPTDLEDIPVEQTPQVSGVESALRGAAAGASFGFADEITGALESLVSDKTYEQARDESRAAYKAAEEANPGLYTTGELGGGLLSSILPGGIAAKGAMAAGKGVLAAAGTASALGAAEGALGAAGRAAEISDVPQEALAGGAIGGLAGGVLGGALPLAGKAAQSVLKGSRLEQARKLKDAAPEIELGKIGARVGDEARAELDLLASKYTSGPMKEILDQVKTAKGDVGKTISTLREKAGKLNESELEELATLAQTLPTGKITGIEALQRMIPEIRELGTSQASKKITPVSTASDLDFISGKIGAEIFEGSTASPAQKQLLDQFSEGIQKIKERKLTGAGVDPSELQSLRDQYSRLMNLMGDKNALVKDTITGRGSKMASLAESTRRTPEGAEWLQQVGEELDIPEAYLKGKLAQGFKKADILESYKSLLRNPDPRGIVETAKAYLPSPSKAGMEALTSGGKTGELSRKAFDAVMKEGPGLGTAIGQAAAGTQRVVQRAVGEDAGLEKAPSVTSKAIQPTYNKATNLSSQDLIAVSNSIENETAKMRFNNLAMKLMGSDPMQKTAAFSQIQSDPVLKAAFERAGVKISSP
jgi:hypothetical protein